MVCHMSLLKTLVSIHVYMYMSLTTDPCGCVRLISPLKKYTVQVRLSLDITFLVPLGNKTTLEPSSS